MPQPLPSLPDLFGRRSAVAYLSSQPLGRSHRLLDAKDKFFSAAGIGPDYDWPNPRGYVPSIALRSHSANPLQTTLKSRDQFFAAPGIGPDYDYPNPRGYAYPSDLRTFINPIEIQLNGKDRFFAAAGMGPTYDYPNPRGHVPSIELRTHSQSSVNSTLKSQDQFFGLAGNPTFDWPLATGHRPELARPGTLRGYTQSYALSLIGQDAFYSAPGEVPSYDWPNPKGAIYSADLRVFYPTVFVWQRGLQTIIDTDILQRPVNVVMAGDVPIKGSGIEYDIRPANFRARVAMSGSSTRRLNGDKAGFTVRTDKKGYD